MIFSSFQNLILAVLGLLAAIIFLIFYFLWDLHKKWRMIFSRTTKNQNDLLSELIARIMKLEIKLEIQEPKIAFLEKTAKISVQKVGFKRYNPFTETGGDQSFTIALLDWQNNGVIFSSLYLREGVRVYAKNIAGGKPVQPLSDEEKEVLEETINKN